METALEREKCQKFGLTHPTPRVEEVLRSALGNFRKLLRAKMRTEGIELAGERSALDETNAPPLVIGPDVDD